MLNLPCRAVAVALVSLGLSGCGESFSATAGTGGGGTATTSAGGNGGNGAGGSAVSAGGDAGSGGMSSAAGGGGGGGSTITECKTPGDCGQGEDCINEICVCAGGGMKCDSVCTSIDTDPENCGGCDHHCALTCAGGECDDPIDIATGGDTTCAVLAHGSVYCWGRNNTGQLGGPDPSSSPTPVKIPGLPGMKRVFVGKSGDNTHVCALSYTSELYCWGSNEHGKLGIGQAGTGAFPPEKVPGANVASVALGGRHSCVATTSGNLACWGANDYKQQGFTGTGTITPKTVSGITAGALSAGSLHTCSIVSGALSCWGRNVEGQIGAGSFGSPLEPSVVGLSGNPAAEAVGGEGHTCVRVASGNMACWGAGVEGQLGTGGIAGEDKPAPVIGLPGAVSTIAAGSGHTGAIIGGDVWLWGRNAVGQVSAEQAGLAVLAPVKALADEDAQQLALGAGHSCARVSGGHVWCWGRNDAGQLGIGLSGGDHVPPSLVSFD